MIIMTIDNNSIVIIIVITIITIMVISTITILIVFTIIILVYIYSIYHIYIYHHISTIIYPWYFRKLEKTMTTSAHSSLELARATGIAMFRLQAKEYNSK